MTGSSPPLLATENLLARYADFTQRLPVLARQIAALQAVSYTQWEAYLAVYHQKPLILAVPRDSAPRDQRFLSDDNQRNAQRTHLLRLREFGRYPEIEFSNGDRLAVDLFRSRLHDILESAGGRSSYGDLSSETQALLASLNIPYEVISYERSGAVFKILDPTSLFSNQFVLAVATVVKDFDFIDRVLALSRERLKHSQAILATTTTLSSEISKYAESRGLLISTYGDFQKDFMKLASRERYCVGLTSANTLCQTLNIADIYVDQDAVPLAPGGQGGRTRRWFSNRSPSSDPFRTWRLRRWQVGFLCDPDEAVARKALVVRARLLHLKTAR
jgi:hypothetical protein